MKLLASTVMNNGQVRRQFDFWDDFYSYADAGLWTKTTNSGTVSVGNSHGGILTLTPTGSANDYAYVATTNSFIVLAANTTTRIAALFKYTEANVNKAMVAFGLCNSVGQNTIVDTTGVPVSSFTGAMFYKLPSTTVWSVRSSVGTTKTDTQALANSAGVSTYQFLEIEFKVVSLTRVEVTYYVDGLPVLDPSASIKKILLHTLDATSAAAAQVFFGTKNGDANAQAILIDGCGWSVIRG